VSIILSHAGGFLPYAASRVQVVADVLANVDHDTVWEGIRRFPYDLALSVPSALPTLLATVDPSHILYGTDWSGVPASVVEQATRAFDEAAVIDDRTRQAINRNNALKLLPGLAGRLNTTPTPAAVR
jgi:predicted TIM-barrel fold metal-dependent hydrolase